MPKSELVQALLRGLDIVELAGGAQDGLTLKQMADALGLKPPTVHNLARTLVSRGYLEKTSGRPRYALGPAVVRVAEAFWRRALVEQAEAEVGGLYSHFDEATVVFVEAVGGDLLSTLRMSPERPGVLERPRNRRMHPYGTASALVFQAFWTEEERRAYQERNAFWEFGAHLWRTERKLDEFLEQVRKKGTAVPDFKGKGIVPAAAPVFGSGGELAASIGGSLPEKGASRRMRGEFVRAVTEAAKRLSGTE